MRYIVDLKNSVTEEEFNAWVSEHGHVVAHTFDHFEKTYLIESDKEITVSDIVDHVMVDDHTTALKLLLDPTFTLDTEHDDDWWKTVIVEDALDYTTPEVFRRGEGYAVYLMDSGVNSSHSEFANANVRDLFSHTGNFTDTNGHGTALASVIVGDKCGITKSELVSVKIFENGVPTLISDLLKGLDSIVLDYAQHYPSKPAIVNMSWSINKNEYVENKIRAMMDLGLIFVASAGNSGVPITDVTPAGMDEVLTIGSVNTELEPSDFSNYTGDSHISVTNGEMNYSPGLDYWAPGEHIKAAKTDGTYGNVVGTSIAAAITSAAIIYNFAKLSLEYGKVYRMTGVLTEILENKGLVAVTRETLRNEVKYSSPNNTFILSRPVVDLTEKYKNCTTRMPFVKGIKSETLEDYDYFVDNKKSSWYYPSVIALKGVEVHTTIIDKKQVDSFSISSLPVGLSLVDNAVVGTMNEDLGGEKFKSYTSTLTMTKGEDTLEVEFQVIYVDPNLISEDFTSNDYSNLLVDSGILLALRCAYCGFNPACIGPGYVCLQCEACTDPKQLGELCLANNQGCP